MLRNVRKKLTRMLCSAGYPAKYPGFFGISIHARYPAALETVLVLYYALEHEYCIGISRISGYFPDNHLGQIFGFQQSCSRDMY